MEAVIESEDLLTQILLRLPAKSLLACICVCKQWLSLIRNPNFCRSHAHRHHSSSSLPSGLFFSSEHTFTPQFFSLTNSKDSSDSKVPDFDYLGRCGVLIKGSCNGLLILCSGYSFDQRIARYFVCNPTTKQFARIPTPIPKPVRIFEFILEFHLAFDPSESLNYKVVAIRKSRYDPNDLQIDLYSSETDDWIDPCVSFTPPSGFLNNSGVFWNNCIHFYPLFFDVGLHCLRAMPIIPNKKSISYLAESRGHLIAVALDKLSLKDFDIWEMKDDYSDWSVKYTVNFSGLKGTFPEMITGNWFTVLCVVEGTEEEDVVIVFSVMGVVMSYELRYKELRKLQDLNLMATVNSLWASRSSKFNQRVRFLLGNGDNIERSFVLLLNHTTVFQYFETLAPV